MNKERKLGRVARTLLVGSLVVSCRELISPQQPPEPAPSVLPFETPQLEVPEVPTPTPEIEFVKNLEGYMARGEIIKEEDVELYTHNLITAYHGTMDCRGFRFEETVTFIWNEEEMKKVWQEEGIEPIVFYRTGITNELARRVADRVFGPDQMISLILPDSRRFEVSRARGFALYGIFEEEKGEMLTNFNEAVILWSSNEFAQWWGLSPVVMAKDKEQLELTQGVFSRLGISFIDVWPYYRESKALEFASFVGGKMGGMTERERLSLGFGLFYALDEANKETIDILLPPLEV